MVALGLPVIAFTVEKRMCVGSTFNRSPTLDENWS